MARSISQKSHFLCWIWSYKFTETNSWCIEKSARILSILWFWFLQSPSLKQSSSWKALDPFFKLQIYFFQGVCSYIWICYFISLWSGFLLIRLKFILVPISLTEIIKKFPQINFGKFLTKLFWPPLPDWLKQRINNTTLRNEKRIPLIYNIWSILRFWVLLISLQISG